MMKVCERFPQIGLVRNYMSLPPGEKALYDQYTLNEIITESKTPVLKIVAPRGGGRR